jgi:Cysteine rich repeat
MMTNRVAISTVVSVALMAFAASASAASLQFCKEDAARLCPGVEPGKGRLIKCMKEHENEVSIGCAKELKKLKG